MTVVCRVANKSIARFSVCVVKSQGVADLLVYQAENPSEAKWDEAVWSFSNHGPGTTSVHFTDAPTLADICVHFVSKRSLAGWMRRHRLKGKLGR